MGGTGAADDDGAAFLYTTRWSGYTDSGAADTIIEAADEGNLGSGVSGAGDFDGSGAVDIALGNDAAAYLFLDPVAGNWTTGDATYTLLGSWGDDFGAALANAGDVDGDGLDDLLVGADEDDTNDTNTGAAFLMYGR